MFLCQAEDKADVLNKELLATKSQLTEAEEEKKQWELEANQVKEMCRRELDRLDTEVKRSNTIIADYKQAKPNLCERVRVTKNRISVIVPGEKLSPGTIILSFFLSVPGEKLFAGDSIIPLRNGIDVVVA